MTEYTPSEGDLIRAWKAYRDAADAANAWVREDNAEPAEDEARRALARVRRDAAREAWTVCASEAFALGWLHPIAMRDMNARNPYREETP